jgi:adenosine/AMP kinase
MELKEVKIENPGELNIIIGQAHFIKTAEDIYETLVTSVPAIKFGLAFCEASGPCLIRTEGTDEDLVKQAADNAMKIGAGHCFVLILGPGFFPVNILQALKRVPEVCNIFCATANPVSLVIAKTAQGQGILGVIDGFSPSGIETQEDKLKRRDFLKVIGYKK